MRPGLNGRGVAVSGAQPQPPQHAAFLLHHAQPDFLAEAPAHDRAEVAQPVDQPERQRPPPGPEGAGEQFLLRSGQAGAAAGAHHRLERLVHVGLEGLQMGDPVLPLRREGVEQHLLVAGGVEAPFDAVALDQPMQPEAGRHHADGADDGAFVGPDLVRRAGQPVAARGRGILAEGEDRHLLLFRQIADPLGDQRRLHRRPARRVDDQRHRLLVLGREGALQQRGDAGQRQAGAERTALADDPGQADDGHQRPGLAPGAEGEFGEEGFQAHAGRDGIEVSRLKGSAPAKNRLERQRFGVPQHPLRLRAVATFGLVHRQAGGQAGRRPAALAGDQQQTLGLHPGLGHSGTRTRLPNRPRSACRMSSIRSARWTMVRVPRGFSMQPAKRTQSASCAAPSTFAAAFQPSGGTLAAPAFR